MKKTIVNEHPESIYFSTWYKDKPKEKLGWCAILKNNTKPVGWD